MKNRMALCNWSPIKTAPKDQEIWLGRGGEMQLGYWGKAYKNPGPRGGKGKYVKSWCEAPGVAIDFKPTHWQHIPNPPGV